MPPKPTGQVIERETRDARMFALRFRAYGERQYLRLGSTGEGWSRERAERELRHVLADVERGIWIPPVEAPAAVPPDPGFHAFASQWLTAREGELRDTTVADYTWQLCNHLLPFFHRHRLSEITVAEVDRYREHKVREGVLSAESINKTITRLGQILAVAEERDLVARNPVRVNTRNRKLKARRPRAVFLDSAEAIQALLDAATELDRRRPHQRSPCADRHACLRRSWGLHVSAVGWWGGARGWPGLPGVLRGASGVVRSGLEVPGLPGLAALARWLRVPAVRTRRRLASARPALALRGL